MKLQAAFLKDRNLYKIMTLLADAGGAVRLVGGCVRNAIMRLPVTDIDLATTLLPAQVMTALHTAGIKVIPTGIAHGTVTAVLDGQPFEITTLRRDIVTDGRHAQVGFTTEWRQDAQRRDFTMNALYADLQGQVYDYFDGIMDAKIRHVRFVGDAATRIAEDYLRILRFYRFHAQYGQGALDAAARGACRDLRAGLAQLSTERVQQELIKLLQATHYTTACRMLAEDGILDNIVPQLNDAQKLAKHAARENLYAAASWLARLVAWCGGNFKAAFAVAAQLKFSKTQQDYVKDLARVYNDVTKYSLPELLYRYGVPLVKDALLLNLKTDVETALSIMSAWQKPMLPISGKDLVMAGMAPGPQLGRVLKQVETWWIARGFTPDAAACLAEAKQLTG